MLQKERLLVLYIVYKDNRIIVIHVVVVGFVLLARIQQLSRLISLLVVLVVKFHTINKLP